MKTKIQSKLLTLTLLSTLCFQISTASAQYTFTTIDSPGAASTYPGKINDVGQIVGVHLDASRVQHSLLTDISATTFTVFDPPIGGPRPGGGFGAVSGAAGINNLGQIVGFVQDATVPRTHGYTLINGVYSYYDHPNGGTEIPGSGARGTGFDGINDAGVILGGYIDNADNSQSFIKNGATVTLVSHPSIPAGAQIIALDINNAGTITGYFYTSDDPADNHGFILDSAGNLTLIDVPGALYESGYGLNDRGDVAGEYWDANDVAHGFVRTASGTLSTVDFPGVRETYLADIDNAGRLIGGYGQEVDQVAAGIHGFLAVPIQRPPHTLKFYLHGHDIPGTAGGFTMNQTPAPSQTLTLNLLTAPRWFSVPVLNCTFGAGATFKVVITKTAGLSLATKYRLSATNPDGSGEQTLGQSVQLLNFGTQSVMIPVTTPVTLTNKRLKLTISSVAAFGVNLQMGNSAFLEVTNFTGTP
ncbi:MAG TPA: hypothetical protein VG796_15730 [Verrucomicrobiales bacterium]|nr:hypothetical protein [Verrucomicrobiales bacterium]